MQKSKKEKKPNQQSQPAEWFWLKIGYQRENLVEVTVKHAMYDVKTGLLSLLCL